MCCKKIIIAAVKGDDSFEEALIEHCASMLAFIKMANL